MKRTIRALYLVCRVRFVKPIRKCLKETWEASKGIDDSRSSVVLDCSIYVLKLRIEICRHVCMATTDPVSIRPRKNVKDRLIVVSLNPARKKTPKFVIHLCPDQLWHLRPWNRGTLAIRSIGHSPILAAPEYLRHSPTNSCHVMSCPCNCNTSASISLKIG